MEPLQFPYIYLYACKVLTLIYIYIDAALSSARACNRGYHVHTGVQQLVQAFRCSSQAVPENPIERAAKATFSQEVNMTIFFDSLREGGGLLRRRYQSATVGAAGRRATATHPGGRQWSWWTATAAGVSRGHSGPPGAGRQTGRPRLPLLAGCLRQGTRQRRAPRERRRGARAGVPGSRARRVGEGKGVPASGTGDRSEPRRGAPADNSRA